MAITVFTNAFLIDCTGKDPVDGAAVVVEGERIKDVVRSGRVGPLRGRVPHTRGVVYVADTGAPAKEGDRIEMDVDALHIDLDRRICSLVYRTVQLHNGDIDVESTPGRGTTFVIKMPKAGPATGGSAVTPSLKNERRVGA